MSSNFISKIIEDLIIAGWWHLLVLIVTVRIKDEFFYYKKRLYRIYSWEKNGNFYIKYLKIKLWKDKLPQFMTKGGFSKRNFIEITKITREYLEKFILETCRAEWNHFVCSLGCVVMTIFYKDFLFFIAAVFNFPFICIQRFNRIRLLRLHNKLFSSKKLKKAADFGSIN